MSQGYVTLTEKEKQTLRLIVRGHDAKSIARHLDLSVHTVNERLREARRKLSVSSSRAAARLVLETEGDASYLLAPDFLGDSRLGEAASYDGVEQDAAPKPRTRRGLAWVSTGVVVMSLILAVLALSSSPPVAVPSIDSAVTTEAIAETDALQSARAWLALVDAGRWNESWNATGKAFRKLNTSKTWASVSEDVRTPLGAALSRTATSQESVPAPPYGYEMVKFRTSFANKPATIETVTLSREGASWKVVGYIIG